MRRSCAVIGVLRSSYYYRSRRADDRLLRVRIRDLAESRRRFGYRRLHVMLLREGWEINHTSEYTEYTARKG